MLGAGPPLPAASPVPRASPALRFCAGLPPACIGPARSADTACSAAPRSCTSSTSVMPIAHPLRRTFPAMRSSDASGCTAPASSPTVQTLTLPAAAPPAPPRATFHSALSHGGHCPELPPALCFSAATACTAAPQSYPIQFLLGFAIMETNVPQSPYMDI